MYSCFIIKEVEGIWYSTPLSTIFQLYHGSQFYWWRKPELLEIKLSDISEGEVGIPLSGLTPPHFCACPIPGPEFPVQYAIINFVVNCLN
jgi:hypothetical protein